MITTYQHTNAGTVYIVYGIAFDDRGLGARAKIRLYRIGENLHEIIGDMPQGIATFEESEHLTKGWGLTGQVVKVTSPNGGEIIVEKTDIEKIK